MINSLFNEFLGFKNLFKIKSSMLLYKFKIRETKNFLISSNLSEILSFINIYSTNLYF